jgi:ABC-type Mn2+/Zn2+ transport system permease subunit
MATLFGLSRQSGVKLVRRDSAGTIIYVGFCSTGAGIVRMCQKQENMNSVLYGRHVFLLKS